MDRRVRKGFPLTDENIIVSNYIGGFNTSLHINYLPKKVNECVQYSDGCRSVRGNEVRHQVDFERQNTHQCDSIPDDGRMVLQNEH